MVPLKDNVMLVYGVDFQQPTDQIKLISFDE